MPIDKNKLIRFQVLDRCFSDRVNKYYMEDLIRECNAALRNADCTAQSVSRSSIFVDIQQMTTNPNWPGANLLERKHSSDGRRRYYRYEDPNYSIWKRDMDEYQLSQLQSILLMLRQFRDFPQYNAIEDVIEQLEEAYRFKLDDAEGVIAFESNENLDALTLVGSLFSHICHRHVLKVLYQPFQKEALEYVVHPHYLKQYNRRWFLIGLTVSEDGRRGRTVLPLDRIQSVEQIVGEYIESDKDLEDLFDDQIGVTLMKCDAVDVKLQFTAKRFLYVVTKPLHASQRIVSKEDGIVSIRVKPNKELYQTLLSFGGDVKVLEPTEVASQMKEEIERMRNCY